MISFDSRNLILSVMFSITSFFLLQGNCILNVIPSRIFPPNADFEEASVCNDAYVSDC